MKPLGYNLIIFEAGWQYGGFIKLSDFLYIC